MRNHRDSGGVSHRSARSWPLSRELLTVFWKRTERFTASSIIHHTAKRISERLRDEHGLTCKQTIVKNYVRERSRRLPELFVPLAHSPGHAQADGSAPSQSALDAVKRVHRLLNTGHREVVDADLSDYSGQIPHAELLKSVGAPWKGAVS